MAAITTNAGMSMNLPSTSNKSEITESIEWDLPYDSFDGEFPDFSNLSLGTEMRNKMWESNNKMTFGGIPGAESPSSIDQNPNITLDSLQYFNSVSKSIVKAPYQSITSNIAGADNEIFSGAKYNIKTTNGSISPAGTGGGPPVTNNIHASMKTHLQNPPLLLHSPIPMPGEIQSPERLSSQENGYSPLEQRRMNENQTMKEQLEEIKAVLKRLAADGDDITLPQLVQLPLKLIEQEHTIQEQEVQIKNQELELSRKSNEIEQLKHDQEYELVVLKKEIKYLKESLEKKSSEQTEALSSNADDKEIKELKEELILLKEEAEKKQQEVDKTVNDVEQKLKMAQFDLANYQNELKTITLKYEEEQVKDQKRKVEIQRFVATVRESIEKERRDQYHFICEHNQLKHKWDKLNENCKSYQMKNEELCRIQNELEKECDQFRALKKIIQDHGLNHEHLVLLQQQKEMFKDDVLTERKDRERAQAQRDKLRRDLDILHSRNQSLQEQVYKYQEHIMRLNTGDRRSQHPEFMHQHQGNGRFSRQLSNPAYFNPRIRMGPNNIVNPLIKPHQMQPSINNGAINNRQTSPINDTSRMTNGFSTMNGRVAHNLRSPQGFNGGYDPWHQQQTQQQQQQQRNGFQQLQQHQLVAQQQQQRGNNFVTTPQNQIPQSPLLGPNGDPWLLASNQQNSGQQQQQQLQQHQVSSQQQIQNSSSMSNGNNYSTSIWSQQPPPSSPTTFSASPSMRSSQSSSPSWQVSESPSPSSLTGTQSPVESSGVNSGVLKAVPGGDLWSTAADDSQSSEQNSFMSSIENGRSDQQRADQRKSTSDNGDSNRFLCGKCNTKLTNTEAFRDHVEQCFS